VLHRKGAAIAAILTGWVGVVATPLAWAAPVPGSHCDSYEPGSTTPVHIGNVACVNAQRNIWVSDGEGPVGGPCSAPGDVRQNAGADVNFVKCVGGVWQSIVVPYHPTRDSNFTPPPGAPVN
jgi:hypothetical protein